MNNVIDLPTRRECAPLPSDFEMKADGWVHRVIDDGEGNRRTVPVCSEIRVLALPRDRSGTGWGRLVEVIDPDGNAHRWAIPASMFAGDGIEMRARLLDLGLRIAPGGAARNALADLLQRWQPPDRATTTDRLGWSDETCTTFTLGDGRTLGSGQVVYQAETVASVAAAMVAAGTLEGWREHVARACTDNPLMIVAVSLALAGPLLEPLGMDGGGIHLRGESSRGKSTIQRVAVSVWGAPGFLGSWRATANGLEGQAMACNSTLLALDEIGEVSAKEVGNAVYMLGNGQGKTRSDRTGQARAQKRWRAPILSSGEISLADKMAEDGRRVAAGQNVRLLDASADTGRYGAFDHLHGEADGAAFSDRLRGATATNYGTAGPAFVAAFLDDPDAAKANARAAIATFDRDARELYGTEADGQTTRAAARLGLIAAAGEMAAGFGLTGWQTGAAHDAALHVLGLWIEGRGGVGPTEAREAIERTRAFLIAHDSRFERLDACGDQRPAVHNRAGWRDGHTYYVAPSAWAEIHRGADPQRAARYVHEAGFLEPGDGRHLTRRTPRTVSGRPRAYAVNPEIMGEGEA